MFLLPKPMLFVAAALLVLLSTGSVASNSETLVKADNKSDLPVVVEALRTEMTAGGRYQFITPQEHVTVIKGLVDMQSMLDAYEKVSLIPMSAKLQMVNAQELVNKTLTKRDGERLICNSEAPPGPHIFRTT